MTAHVRALLDSQIERMVMSTTLKDLDYAHGSHDAIVCMFPEILSQEEREQAFSTSASLRKETAKKLVENGWA